MNTVSNFCVRIRQLVGRFQTAIGRLPRFASVLRGEGAGGRDRNENSIGSTGSKNDRVQTHPARPGLRELALGAVQPVELLPGLATLCRLEQRRGLSARVNGDRIVQ